MAHRRTEPILRPRQARYLERLRPPLDAVGREAATAAARHSLSIPHPDVARLFEALAAAKPAGRVLEIGTATGYGTLHLARGAAAGRVVSIAVDGTAAGTARELLGRAGLLERVELIDGGPEEVLTRLVGAFDLVTFDGGTPGARRLLDQVLPRLVVGGTVLVDHLLGRGRIADPSLRDGDDPEAEAVERFNPYFTIHPQLATVLLPVGDGVGLGVKRRPTRLEMGGPF